MLSSLVPNIKENYLLGITEGLILGCRQMVKSSLSVPFTSTLCWVVSHLSEEVSEALVQ